ncbi:MAG: glutathione peroxidase [Burkholderiaceae bacterium]
MTADTATSIYDFSATSLDGKRADLAATRGKVLLIVNTASQCGFTPQYEGLEALYEKYHDQGFEVLGFPCNQFGSQEPGASTDIAQFCETKFGVTFPMFEKVDVNGDGAHPLFKWIKGKAPGLLGSKDIKWNFTKFLVDRNGKVVDRFAPTTRPDSMKGDIEKLLKS